MCKYAYFLFFIGLSSLLVVFSSSFPATAVAADQEKNQSKVKYVSDNIAITMRTGKSGKHRVIETLNSGEKLRLLEVGQTYSRVKTGKGKEGWVLTQYLANEPSARNQLPTAIEKIAMLESENKAFKQQLTQVTQERDKLQNVAAKYSELETNHQKLAEETYELKHAAANYTEMLAQQEELTKKTQFLQNQLDIALNENKELRDESRKKWFLIGAGVVLVSMLFGSMLGRSRRKAKNSTWASGADTLVLRQH